MEDIIRNKFDDVLSRNMERLVGTRYGIGGLSTGVNSLSCIILLNEQVTREIGEDSITLEDYTREALFDELEEMGLDTGDGMDATIQDLISKGYVEFDENNRILVKKPTVTMARLLDRIYPRMPGLNLIAYLGQVLDEAHSERKDLDVAIDQLDQVLQMNGVSLKLKQSSLRKKETTRSNDLRAVVRQSLLRIGAERLDTGGRIIKASDVLVSKKSGASQPESNAFPGSSDDMISEGKPQEMGGNNTITANGSPASTFHDIKGDVESAHVDAVPERVDEQGSSGDQPEKSPDLTCLEVYEQHEAIDVPTGVSINSEDVVQDIQQESLPPSPSVVPECPERRNVSMVQPADESSVSGAGEDTISTSEESRLSDGDVSIESQIAAFEAGLAMKCPLCNIGNVRVNETSTGRRYYVCSHKDCAFISWGKPYHIACPDCGNNFLIETVLKGGVPVLKCPRATCFYWQKRPSEILNDTSSDNAETAVGARRKLVAVAAKPRKKVVRRRVVRKKSS